MNKEDVRIGKKQDRLIDSKRLLENLEYLRKAHLTEADVSSQDVKAYYRGFHAALKLVTGMAEHIAGTSVVRCKDCCFFDKDKKRCDHPEGWYRENIHEVARKLMEDKDGQSFLLSALKEKTGEDFEPHNYEF